MPRQEPPTAFGQAHAATYDQRFAKLAAMRDALHLLTAAVFADLAVDSRILCVGAGTGHELIYLAQKFPKWRFAVVEPSGPMLDLCRKKADDCGIAARCEFHEGYLDSLPPALPFDAANSLLVSQFILDLEARIAFFRGIAERLTTIFAQPEKLEQVAEIARSLGKRDAAERLADVVTGLLPARRQPEAKREIA